MEICEILLSTLPVVLLSFLFFLPHKRRCLTSMAPWISVFYVLVLTVCIAGYPSELATDGDRYVRGYYNALYYGIDYEYKDVGWIVYEVLCANMFGNNIWLFWLFTAFTYVSSYYFLAISYFAKSRIIYLLIMASGMIGFSSYGTNTIRNGIAIAIVLFAFRKYMKLYLRVLLFAIATLFHKSMALMFLAFYISKLCKKDKLFVMVWICCLVLSFIHFDLGFIFDQIGFLDSRVGDYVDSMDDSSGNGYKVGFRWDFVLYSSVPIAISIYYLYYKKYVNEYFQFFFRMYLILNAMWLLVIRIPYTDRMAYLSWCLIPIVTLYPLLDNPSFFYNPQKRILQIMFVFMSVFLVLQIR